MLDRIATASREDLVRLTQEVLSGKKELLHLTPLIWERWLEVDAEGGLQALLAGEFGGENRMPQVWEYLGKWSVKDPETALVRAMALPEKLDTDAAMSRITTALAARRPADFFRLYAELAKWDHVGFAIGAAAGNLAATDPRAMAALLKDPPDYLKRNDETREKACRGLASRWGSTDPAAAAAWFREMENPKDRAQGLNEIANQVITRDPVQAAALIRESGSVGIDALKAAAMTLAQSDPEAALAWLKKEFPEESVAMAGNVASQHIPRTAQAAVDYLVQHADMLFSNGKIQLVPFINWSLDDPAAALAMAEKIQDPGTLSDVRALLLGAMANRSPREALAAASPGEEQNRLMFTAVENWAKQDLTAASAWLAAQPAGSSRDSGIERLLRVTLRLEPESAMPWAAAVSEAPARIFAFTWVLKGTGMVEQEAATAALQAVAASPEEIQQVVKNLKPRNPNP
jgi:hypothetical protein